MSLLTFPVWGSAVALLKSNLGGVRLGKYCRSQVIKGDWAVYIGQFACVVCFAQILCNQVNTWASR